MGHRDIRWPVLLPVLKGQQGLPPHILDVHLGGNNLNLLKGKALIIRAKGDLAAIKNMWPKVQIIFSALLPCHIWQGLGDVWIERDTRKFNQEIKRARLRGLGEFLSHIGVWVEYTHLNRPYGMRMSSEGNNIVFWKI